jgi:hypothetical protein
MLTTRITLRDDRPFCELLANGKSFVSFYFPLMETKQLRKMIAGQDAHDQNDDGFYITLKNGVVTIQISVYADSDECNDTKFDLPHAVCKPAFEQLLPLYEANPDCNSDDDETDPRLAGIPSGPCNCGRDGCDDCRALKEGRDVHAEMSIRGGKLFFHMRAVGESPELDFEFPNWSNNPESFQDLINGNDCEYELGNGMDIIVQDEVVHIGATPNDDDNDPPSWKFSHDRCQQAFEDIAKLQLKSNADDAAKLVLQDGDPWFSISANGRVPGLDFVFPDWSEHKERFQDLINGTDCEYDFGNGYDLIIEDGIVHIGADDADKDPWSRSFPHARAKRAFQEVAKFYGK